MIKIDKVSNKILCKKSSMDEKILKDFKVTTNDYRGYFNLDSTRKDDTKRDTLNTFEMTSQRDQMKTPTPIPTKYIFKQSRPNTISSKIKEKVNNIDNKATTNRVKMY